MTDSSVPLRPKEDKFVRFAFFADVLEMWCFEGSEWGEVFAPLQQALEHGSNGILMLPPELSEAIVHLLFAEIERGLEDGWLSDAYEDEVATARENYLDIVEYWDEHSKQFDLPPDGDFQGVDAHAAFQRAEREIPQFMRPVDPKAARERRKRQITEELESLGNQRAELEAELASLMVEE